MRYIQRNSILKFFAFLLTLFAWSNEVSALLPADSAKIEFDKEGNAVAVWEAIDDLSNSVIRAATFSDGHWTKPITISPPNQQGSLPQLAVSSKTGNAVAVWLGQDLDTGFQFIVAAKLPDSKNWTPAIIISKSDGSEISFQNYLVRIANDHHNTVLVTWNSFFDGSSVIRAAFSKFDGPWKLKTISN